MSRLAALIDQTADGTRPLSDVLRQVKIVASRIGDVELSTWATKELSGYGVADDLPAYRSSRRLPVRGNWSGPMGSGINNASVSWAGVPEEFHRALFCAEFRQSVAELEMVGHSDGGGGARIDWDPRAVWEYNKMVREGEGGAGFEMMELLSAHVHFPRNILVGILDAIRTRVLDLALDLERVSPEVGEPGGPTVSDAQVEAAVQTFHITIHGDGANVSTGDHAKLRSTVKKGDAQALVEAAREIGLSPEDAESFREAVEADGDAVAERTQGFVERVRSGAVVLVGNTSGSLAATGLIQAAGMFFGA